MTHKTQNYEVKSNIKPDITQDPRFVHLTTTLKDDLTEKIESLGEKIAHKMQQQAIEHTQKPFLPTDHEINHEVTQYKSAFNQFIRTGNEAAIQDMQLKALEIAGTGAEGGVLVSPHLSEQILATVKHDSPMRRVCKTVTMTGNIAEFIIDPYFSGSGWAAETDVRTETATSDFKKISVPIHELYALPKASQRILDDSAFNIEQWITERVAEKFTALENQAFTIGDGNNKPSGILSKDTSLVNNWNWGTIGTIKTGAATNFPATNPADVLLDMIYALKSGYRHNAVFMMNSQTLAQIRKFKDADGRYLIHDGASSDHTEPTLFGYKIIVNEDMDDVLSGKLPVLFGDFARAYVIVDSYDMRILRDPYSAKPYVYFYVTKRVGGDVLDYDAVKGLEVNI